VGALNDPVSLRQAHSGQDMSVAEPAALGQLKRAGGDILRLQRSRQGIQHDSRQLRLASGQAAPREAPGRVLGEWTLLLRCRLRTTHLATLARVTCGRRAQALLVQLLDYAHGKALGMPEMQGEHRTAHMEAASTPSRALKRHVKHKGPNPQACSLRAERF